MVVKFNVFKEDDNKDFGLVQNLEMGEADFNEFMQLSNQLISAVEYFAVEKNLSPVVMRLMSKAMGEKLNLAHKVVGVVDRANTINCMTSLRYSVDKTDSSYAQVRLLARKRRREVATNCLCDIKTRRNCLSS